MGISKLSSSECFEIYKNRMDNPFYENIFSQSKLQALGTVYQQSESILVASCNLRAWLIANILPNRWLSSCFNVQQQRTVSNYFFLLSIVLIYFIYLFIVTEPLLGLGGTVQRRRSHGAAGTAAPLPLLHGGREMPCPCLPLPLPIIIMPSACPDQPLEVEAHSHTLPQPLTASDIAIDGASSMKNLALLIKNRVSKHALYVHCFAHCNELVFEDASSLSSIISDGQEFCENIYVLVGVSRKRVWLFPNVQKEMPEVPGNVGDSNINDNNSSHDSKGNVILKLKILSTTRWTTRGAAADVIMRRYHALQETLSILSTDRSVTAECRMKSEGTLRKLNSFRNV